MSLARRLLLAFEGSDLAHGRTTVGRVARNGKAEANSYVIRELMTEEHVKAHLAGKQGVGSIPINSKNECKFGAIDIDDYDLDQKALAARIKSQKLPLVQCRSKSGGAHLYLFLDDWYPAAMVREYLTEVAALLGYAGREIFPKQDKILFDRGDVGNFINSPYFNADETVRYAVSETGEAMTLEEFLDKVEATRVPLSKLEIAPHVEKREDLKDYPPCLEQIIQQGVINQYRNVTLFSLVVAHRKANPEGWKRMLEESNVRYCESPLPAEEVVNIQKQHEKKDYGFQCTATPLCNFCNKDLCRSRKFGIGGGGTVEFPKLTGMTILNSSPKMFFLDYDGKRLEITSQQLTSQTAFQNVCVEQVDRMPPTIKAAEWNKVVNGLLDTAIHLEAPPELTLRGQFEDLIREYCTSNIRAMVAEEVAMGKPWTDKGLTKFTFAGLMEFLKFRGFTHVSRVQVQNFIKDLNDGRPCHGHQGVRKEDGGTTTVRVWWVPAYKDEQVDMKVETNDEAARIPF
jgi:hypothetical protein